MRKIVTPTALPALLMAGVLALGASGPAPAQAPSFDHDIEAPIDFEADRLEIDSEQRIATFTGNVQATQGDLSLRADDLSVYFHQDGPADITELADDGVAGFSVARIDAEGGVTLTAPNESARGDWAVYDVDNKLVTLGGRVKLTRGSTVIEGNRLELDLQEGRSKIESVPGTETPRVRGSFVPGETER